MQSRNRRFDSLSIAALILAVAGCSSENRDSSVLQQADLEETQPSDGPSQKIGANGDRAAGRPGSLDDAAPPRSGLNAAVSPDGYGPVEVGMPLPQASRALGAELVPTTPLDDAGCGHVRARGLPAGLVFMVQGGRITRATIMSGSSVRTDRGLGLGDRRVAVERAHGSDLEVEPHHYLGEPAYYLTSWSKGRERGVRYETDASGAVIEIHAGDESIRLVEGCS